MTPEIALGKLEPVDLREVWITEPGDFTPWLAREENIALLSEAIGIDLEVEATEKDVGPFRADILCKDTATNDWVLIENQLERTDHTHLGQLLTYGAGLKAVTIVWIAERFTEEHRAALDWLNEITGERFSFFGLEIELWRIGQSPIAPKFNVVCKPNDWTKPAGTDQPVPTETKLLQKEYWTELRELLLKRKSSVKPQKPQAQHWTNFGVGRSCFSLFASVNTQKGFIQVGMSCTGPSAKPHFKLLLADKESIEQAAGMQLEWEELPNRKESKVAIRRNGVDPTNRSDWPAQHVWLADVLDTFHRVFAPRVKELDADDLEVDPDVSAISIPGP
jgi:hypothetical protein